MAQDEKATFIAYVKRLADKYKDYPTISTLFTQLGDFVNQGAPKSQVLDVLNQLLVEQKNREALMSLFGKAAIRHQLNENKLILSLINLVYKDPPTLKCTNC